MLLFFAWRELFEDDEQQHARKQHAVRFYFRRDVVPCNNSICAVVPASTPNLCPLFEPRRTGKVPRMDVHILGVGHVKPAVRTNVRAKEVYTFLNAITARMNSQFSRTWFFSQKSPNRKPMSPLLAAKSRAPPTTRVSGREEELPWDPSTKSLARLYHFLCEAMGSIMLLS